MNIQRKNSAHHFRMQGEREQTLEKILKLIIIIITENHLLVNQKKEM